MPPNANICRAGFPPFPQKQRILSFSIQERPLLFGKLTYMVLCVGISTHQQSCSSVCLERTSKHFATNAELSNKNTQKLLTRMGLFVFVGSLPVKHSTSLTCTKGLVPCFVQHFNPNTLRIKKRDLTLQKLPQKHRK